MTSPNRDEDDDDEDEDDDNDDDDGTEEDAFTASKRNGRGGDMVATGEVGGGITVCMSDCNLVICCIRSCQRLRVFDGDINHGHHLQRFDRVRVCLQCVL